MARRLGPPLAAALLVALLPGTASAATPVAVNDPGPACQDPSLFGGAFPIPEDFRGGEPGFEAWFLFFGDTLVPGSTCGVLENDTDADGEPLSIASAIGGQHGEVVIVDPSSIAYRSEPDYSTPAGDWISDEFFYTATDGSTVSNTAAMRIWLAPINDPPSFTAGEDVTAVAGEAYASAWASDIEPGPFTEADQTVAFVIDDVGAPGLFSVGPAIDGDGTLSFTAAPGEGGISTVTVHALDDGGLDDYGLQAGTMDPPDDTSDAVTFSIVVEGGTAHDPVAGDDTATVAEDGAEIAIDVLADDTDADGDALRVIAAGPASHGTVAIATGGTGLRYVPSPDAVGIDAFLYTIDDGTGHTATGLVTVTITPVDDAPVAIGDDATVSSGSGPVAIPVLDDDVDVDGDGLRIVAVTSGKRGTVAITGGGTGLTYDPTQNKHGPDTFTYTISDGQGGTDTATVRITIIRR